MIKSWEELNQYLATIEDEISSHDICEFLCIIINLLCQHIQYYEGDSDYIYMHSSFISANNDVFKILHKYNIGELEDAGKFTTIKFYKSLYDDIP